MKNRYNINRQINTIGNTKYPDIPLSFDDTYVITTEGDRFDILAQQYYGSSSYWWVISIANPSLQQNTMIPPVGQQLRIPSNLGGILASYTKLNQL
tara:strand:+ start:3694 stop:3981 length:288 start_codon:yes stop_codon:yes gene_type:complete